MKAVFQDIHMNLYDCPVCCTAHSENQDTSNKTWDDLSMTKRRRSSCAQNFPRKCRLSVKFLKPMRSCRCKLEQNCFLVRLSCSIKAVVLLPVKVEAGIFVVSFNFSLRQNQKRNYQNLLHRRWSARGRFDPFFRLKRTHNWLNLLPGVELRILSTLRNIDPL